MKRHLAVRQSLRHGLRPCHLPLTREANAAANRETTNPAIPQTNVRDDACIVPETPRRRKVPREGHGPPLQTMANAAANRCGRDHPDDRRAGCPHPAGPCGGANPRGRDKSLPYKPRRARGQPENRNLRVIINLCRGRCLHRPANPAPPQGPAGGPWPSPTNHGGRPANRCGLDHPGDRRAGCPHPAGPCGGGNVYGLIWPPCERGRKRRSGDCPPASCRSRKR